MDAAVSAGRATCESTEQGEYSRVGDPNKTLSVPPFGRFCTCSPSLSPSRVAVAKQCVTVFTREPAVVLPLPSADQGPTQNRRTNSCDRGQPGIDPTRVAKQARFFLMPRAHTATVHLKFSTVSSRQLSVVFAPTWRGVGRVACVQAQPCVNSAVENRSLAVGFGLAQSPRRRTAWQRGRETRVLLRSGRSDRFLAPAAAREIFFAGHGLTADSSGAADGLWWAGRVRSRMDLN